MNHDHLHEATEDLVAGISALGQGSLHLSEPDWCSLVDSVVSGTPDPGHAEVLRAVAAALGEHRRGSSLWRDLAQQLQGALDSRVIIEQAKGVLAERDGLSTSDAFLELRSLARRGRTPLKDVAAEIVATRDR